MANGDNLSHATARDVRAGEGGWWHGAGQGIPGRVRGAQYDDQQWVRGRVEQRHNFLSHRLTLFLMLVSAGLLLPAALLVSAIDVVRPRGSATCCSVHLAGSTRVAGSLRGHVLAEYRRRAGLLLRAQHPRLVPGRLGGAILRGFPVAAGP